MVACERPLPIVVTTNSGYPLDQNLYQAVKGMSAAAQVVADGGYIVTAARCNDGFPQHGNFRRLLFDHASPQSLLDTIMTPGFSMFDQWQAQLLAGILIKARVGCTASCRRQTSAARTSSRWRMSSARSPPSSRASAATRRWRSCPRGR